jgi:Protein of unknown function (DUF2510)
VRRRVPVVGPGLTLIGALATVGVMFLPLVDVGGESLNWWEALNGLDIALLVACVATAGLALGALAGDNPLVSQLGGVFAGVAFGLAFALVPGAIDNSEGIAAGLWIGAATGAIAVAGGVVSALPLRGAPQPGRRSVASASGGAPPTPAAPVAPPAPATPSGPPAPPQTAPTSPAAGWYPDPAGGAGLIRYWDGARWTDATRSTGEGP